MQRPKPVIVFGVLNIVFSVFSALGVLASSVMFMPQMANSDSPVLKIVHENALLGAWLKLAIALGVLSTMALLAAGIGLLQLKPWAWTLSIVYGLYAIVMAIVGAIMNFVFITRPLLAQHQPPSSPNEVKFATITAVAGCFFAVIYPALLLFFMLRPKTKAAFGRGSI